MDSEFGIVSNARLGEFIDLSKGVPVMIQIDRKILHPDRIFRILVDKSFAPTDGVLVVRDGLGEPVLARQNVGLTSVASPTSPTEGVG
jgi:hypothetical protein